MNASSAHLPDPLSSDVRAPDIHFPGVHLPEDHVPEVGSPNVHPWPTGYIFESPGAHLTYRVIGPCCRLYDRHQLPWPCCRIQWRSKEPSWRRIGNRLIADLATRKHPSYCVEIIGQSYRSEPVVMTLYTIKLSAELQNWWHTKRVNGSAIQADKQRRGPQSRDAHLKAQPNAQLKAESKTESKAEPKAKSLQTMSSALLS